jgi:3-dehydroquinate dehydratase-2
MIMNKSPISNFLDHSKLCELHILNGPNLDKLGDRKAEIYGNFSINTLKESCEKALLTSNIKLIFKQTNSEAELIDWVHQANDNASALIINAAGLTHTSVSLGDAVEILDIPVFEVHISQIFGREAYRNTSYIAPHTQGVIAGFGITSYIWAIEAAKLYIKRQDIMNVG